MQRLLNKHMVKKRLWEPTDEAIERPTKRRSSRYCNSAPVIRKKAKKRKLSKVLLPVDKSVANKHVDARPVLRKRRKTNIDNVCGDIQSYEPQRPRYKGLVNPKNNCYFNSVMQCLLHCPLAKLTIENVPEYALSPALREIRILFNRMTNNDALTSLLPYECFKAVHNTRACRSVQMGLHNRQEDVTEFLAKLLEHFEEHLIPIDDVIHLPYVFNIQISYAVFCRQCTYSNVSKEYLRLLSLQLPFPHNEEAADSIPQELNVYSLLDSYHSAENLDEHPCCQCRFTGGTEKKLKIINTPELLLIHLSRFTNDHLKIHTFVKFPTELSTGYIRDGNGQQRRYRLTGMIRHIGASIERGHYIAYMHISGNWYEANDSHIRELSWDTVRALQAYVLFYERI